MKKLKYIVFCTCTMVLSMVFLLFVFSEITNAQSRVIINNAKEIIGFTVDGKPVRKLLGDVQLKTDTITMLADSAYQYLETSQIEAFGNIELQTENEIIWTDKLNYNLKTDLVDLQGRVIIKIDSTTIFSNHVIHDLSTKISKFKEYIRLEDQQEVLTAQSGIYYQKKDSAVFRGNVQIKDENQYIEGDSLFTNRAKKSYTFHDHIFARDSVDNVVLTTNFLASDSTRDKFLKGDSHIVKIDTANSDTTHIWAEYINYFDLDSTYSIHANKQVIIWSNQISAIADTLDYNDYTESLELHGTPKTWHKNLQLSGPYIEATLKDKKIDSLVSYPRPFITQEDTALNRLNQITGDTLRINFYESRVKTVLIKSNSELIRFVAEEENKQAPKGAILINTPSFIHLLFDNGEINKMKTGKNSSGRYIPETPNIENFKLQGFIWNPDLRPQKPGGLPIHNFRPIPAGPQFELPVRYNNYLKADTGKK